MDLDVATATATELAQAVRDRRISSRELLEYLIARGERLNPALNAIVAWDVDRARAAAAAADEATARGELVGPLHGLPNTEVSLDKRRLDIDGTLVPGLPSIAWCCAIGSALLPVVTLPTGLNRAGLPVGVQVIGPFLSDLRLLRIAEMLDAAAGPGFIPPPFG